MRSDWERVVAEKRKNIDMKKNIYIDCINKNKMKV